jgi:hypothetical protein
MERWKGPLFVFLANCLPVPHQMQLTTYPFIEIWSELTKRVIFDVGEVWVSPNQESTSSKRREKGNVCHR